MPAVTELSRPNGEPIAATHSPTFSFEGSPVFTVGSCRASILTTATSVSRSAPRTLPLNSRWSARRTVSSEAPSTTCAFVKITPSVDTMKPDPTPCPPRSPGSRSGRGIPKRFSSSPASLSGSNCAARVDARLVTSMLTTAAPLASTSALKSGSVARGLDAVCCTVVAAVAVAAVAAARSCWRWPSRNAAATAEAISVGLIRFADLIARELRR